MMIFICYEQMKAKSELADLGYSKLLFRKRNGFVFRAPVRLFKKA
jgi:hypothetical protein